MSSPAAVTGRETPHRRLALSCLLDEEVELARTGPLLYQEFNLAVSLAASAG